MTAPITVQKKSDVQGILDRLGITTQARFELIPAVLPVISFERPTPAAQKLAWGRITIGPIALENAHTQLFNPINSGVLLHVDSCIVSASAATEIIIGQHDTALTTLGTLKNFRDRRIPGIPVAQLRSETNVGVLMTAGEMLSSLPVADDPFLLPIDAYLGEGQGIVIEQTVVNLVNRTGWFWEELPPAEL